MAALLLSQLGSDPKVGIPGSHRQDHLLGLRVVIQNSFHHCVVKWSIIYSQPNPASLEGKPGYAMPWKLHCYCGGEQAE